MENAEYPYEYRPSWWRKALSLLSIPAFLLMAVIEILFSINARPMVQLFMWFLTLATLAIIIFLPLLYWRGYLRLYPDYLEFRRFSKLTRIDRKDINAFTLRGSQHGLGSIGIGLKPPAITGITVPYFGEADDRLKDWFADYPDLDTKLKEEREARLLSDPAFGRDENGRAIKIKYDKNNVTGASVLSALIAVCAILFSDIKDGLLYVCMIIPLAIAMAVCLPSVHMAMRERNHTTDWFLVGVWPLVPLAFWAIVSGRPVNEWPIIGWSLILASITLAIGWVRVGNNCKWYLGVTLIPHLAYAFGALSLINCLAAHNATIYEIKPEKVKVGTGRRSSSYVMLPPWGPVTDAQRVGVSREFAKSLRYAEPVCAHLYTGALGWQYYRVDKCGPKPETKPETMPAP